MVAMRGRRETEPMRIDEFQVVVGEQDGPPLVKRVRIDVGPVRVRQSFDGPVATVTGDRVHLANPLDALGAAAVGRRRRQ